VDTQAALTGRVVYPSDPGYDEARLDYNARFSRRPRAVVFCQDAGDVASAVRWARAQGAPLRARSRRHGYEGFSIVDDGVIIDVSEMEAVRVDRDHRVAHIGAGATLLRIYDALGQVGLALPMGTCPTVGIAGLTLGGGFGALARLYGLTCDNLLAVDLVMADGARIRADEAHHEDLLWACRGGGGGNFGVVTDFTFRVHPVTDVSIFRVTWDFRHLREVLEAYQAFAPYADDRLTTALELGARSGGRIACLGQFVGPRDELARLIQPLLGAALPSDVMLLEVPFLEAVGEFAGLGRDPSRWQMHGHPTHRRFKNTSAYVDEPFGKPAIDTVIAWLEAAPNTSCVVGIDAYGGAVNRVPAEATAFPHRRGTLFSMQYQAYWTEDRDEAPCVDWVASFRRAMLPYTVGAYVNYIDADIEDWGEAYYGKNFARLVEVKAKYDPDDVFRFPQSIPPMMPGR
jgi:FAD/FMN-containing dehydrogenase